jgi:hypothetical protein
MAEPQVYNGYRYYQQADGSWKRGEAVSAPAQQGTLLPTPADPMQAPKVREANAGAAVTEGTAPTTIQTNQAPDGFMWVNPNDPTQGVVPIPGYVPPGEQTTAAQRDDVRDRVSRLNQLIRQINRVEDLYNAGPGKTKGVSGVLDYLPSDANSRLDTAGAQLSQQGLAAFRVPGTGTVSDRDAVMFDRGNLPTAANRDVQNQEIIRGLKARVEEELSALGRPKPTWGKDPEDTDGQEQISAMDVLRMGGDQGGGTAAPLADVGSGATIRESYPDAMVQDHDMLVARLVQQGGGRIDPQAYAQERAKLEREYGYQGDPAANAQWATSVNQYLDAGGRTIPSGITPTERLMTAGETMRNNLVNNPVAGAAIGAADALSMGIPTAVAPDQMAALGDAQGGSMLAGQIAGTIGGTMALGGITSAAGKFAAPSIVSRIAARDPSGFARNLATDAAYGAGYGGMTQGDPLTGLAVGTAGSVIGQGGAKALGAGVGGMQISEAARLLRERGVPISVGRQLGLGRVEDLGMSVPGVGDMIRNRQMDSFEGFNRAAFEEAGRPIGFQPTQVGAGGVAEFDDAVSDAYTTATRGVSAPIDTQFYRDLRPVVQSVRGLPDDYRSAAETIIERRIEPAIAGGQITGEQFQQAVRGIKQSRANAGKTPSLAGFEQEYRDALTGMEDLLTGTMTRGAGPDVAGNLNAANAANRGFKTIEDASLDRAKIGTQAGEANVFTPAQLIAASRASERKGFGDNPLMPLGRAGQEVLPSTVPNSGTADRLAFMGAVGGLGALGGGAEFATTNQVGTTADAGLTAGSLAAAAALLGTRRGQQMLETLLITRPQVAQRAGDAIRRRGGLFGSSGNAIAQQNAY